MIKQLQIKKGEEWTGAGSGIFDPGTEAEQILGKDINYGEVFAYLFRRFGYPSYGWDDYKQLTQYFIQTRMEGVALSVQPSLHTSLCFGYMITQELDRTCNEESYIPYSEWYLRAKEWSKKEGKPFTELFERNKEETNALFQQWVKDNNIQFKEFGKNFKFFIRKDRMSLDRTEVSKEEFIKSYSLEKTRIPEDKLKYFNDFDFSKLKHIKLDAGYGSGWVYYVVDIDYKYFKDKCKEWDKFNMNCESEQTKKYAAEIEPRPEDYNEDESGRYIFPKGSVREKVNTALIECIKDLLRPVNVRDWYINIKGRVDDFKQKDVVKPYNYAGYGIGTKFEKELKQKLKIKKLNHKL